MTIAVLSDCPFSFDVGIVVVCFILFLILCISEPLRGMNLFVFQFMLFVAIYVLLNYDPVLGVEP